ncbi:hypothetical protein CBR_g38806 [Chara braunii]|uniref:Uncharacterized protein n=1 Tax=Chara braunii TaxID=69332 RepID=A0A388LQC3_CHABU|nr:hypothetical protein CBR_g38806 [Chara braunii]|eukprot:GBG84524.1 hypothetical protein CBR_g38806 [Chara braunii]
MHPSFFFFLISPPAKGHRCPEDADKRYNNMSKLYCDKLWALDWVGVPGEPGCGAAVFLTEDEGTTWYCCGGIIRSEVDKAMAEKGKVDDRDLRKFFLTSVYDEQGTNWVKTDHKVSFDIALFKGYGQKAFGMKAFSSKRDGNASRMLLPIKFLTKTNGYRRSGHYPTVSAGYQLSLPLVPFDAPGKSLAGLSACSSDRRQDVSTPQPSVSAKEKLITYQRRPSEREDSRGDEAWARGDGEDDENEGENGGGQDHMDCEKAAASGGVLGGNVGGSEMEDEEMEDEEMEDEEMKDEGQDVDVSAELTSKGRGKCTAESSPKRAAPKKQARRKAVQDARLALDAAAGMPGEAGVESKSKARVRKTSQPRKPVRPSRHPKSDDSSDDAEGVPLILPIPVGEITFNQRALNPAIVAGIEVAIEASTRPQSVDDPAPWDPPELVLAPINPLKDADEQGTRVLPEDFDPERADEFFYYPVAGQHSSEAMKRAVAKNSAAMEVFGFRNYDRVRIIYFDDDHTNGYHYVSTCDNTRGDRAMLPSFHQACVDIRGFWDSKKRIGPVGNVSKRDPKGLEHQKTWREFLRSCMGKSCEKALWTECISGKWQQAWTNRMRGYMNVAISKDPERYMMRLFNYIVFKSENKEGKEWKDGNFIDYEGLEKRFSVKAAEWDEERDRIPLEYVRRVPKRLGGEQEEKGLKGAGLKATAALYRDAPFHFKYFVYHAIGRVDLLTAELRRFKNTALNLSWEKKQRRSTLLPVNMQPKELLPAGDKIVIAATNLNCKAAILDLANPKNCLVWTPADFDALRKMMTKLCGNNWILIVFAPQKQHKTVMKQLYNWDDAEVLLGTWKRYLAFGTAVNKYGNWQVDYKDTMAVVLHAEGGDLRKEAYSGYHKAQVGSFAMFVARCERMTFGGNQAMLTYDGYSKIAKEYDAWNPIESGEETETSDLEIEEQVKRVREGMESVPACNAPSLQEKEVRTKSAGASSPTRDVTDRASSIEHMQTDSLTPIQALENVLIHGNRQGFQEKSQSRGNPVNEMRPDDDEDDFAVPNALPKLMPSDDIPDSIAQASEQPYFISDKVPETTSDKWEHHILWHMDLFEPCIVQGKWMMAVHLTKGWKVRARLDEASWLKLTKSEIVFRVRKENDGADEAAIEEKARLLFECLHSKNRLEYKHGFYDLE